MQHTKEPSKLKSIPEDLNSDQSVLSEARCLRMNAQGPAGGEVLEVESVPCGDDSWCLVGSLKFFHHDLRSRLFGGDAGVLGSAGCGGGLPWCAFGLLDVMAGGGRTEDRRTRKRQRGQSQDSMGRASR
jgi:hypothetical protein